MYIIRSKVNDLNGCTAYYVNCNDSSWSKDWTFWLNPEKATIYPEKNIRLAEFVAQRIRSRVLHFIRTAEVVRFEGEFHAWKLGKNTWKD